MLLESKMQHVKELPVKEPAAGGIGFLLGIQTSEFGDVDSLLSPRLLPGPEGSPAVKAHLLWGLA